MNGGVSIKHHSRLNAGFYLYSWCVPVFSRGTKELYFYSYHSNSEKRI